MTSLVVKEAVWTRLNANWTSTTLVDFENKRLQLGVGTDPWVAPHFVGADERQIGIGDSSSRYWRENGVVDFLIAVPAMTGWRDCDTYARQLAILFRGVSISDALTFKSVSPPKLYTQDKQILGNWFIKAILARYEYTYTDPT